MNHKFSRDVEWLCEENHNRRKWAEEVEERGVKIATSPSAPRNDKNWGSGNDNYREAVRTAVLACAMAAGGGAAFAGMGLAMGHGSTIALGILIALVFAFSGISLERKGG